MAQSEASIYRPLALRTRADLQSTAVESAGTSTWVVTDPLSLEHFQFTCEEFTLLKWLREPVSIAELQRRFAQIFPPQSISPDSVWEFIGRLHDMGLVISTASGQGSELLGRMKRDRGRRRWLAWTGLISMRFPGIDPDRFLTTVYPYFRWLFSKPSLLVACLLSGYALSLLLVNFSEFSRRLLELSVLFEVRNLSWLILTLAGVKILHELGHALACKHFGGEVRELGFMLLVFVPCLYCDVTDAWRMPSRWQRIAVSSAGIIVEMVLASIATIVWWFARPGIIELLALNIMIVCSLNTLLVNGNPLLRYDGYYIFSDLLDVPNLWVRSREALAGYWSRWLYKHRAHDSTNDPLVPTGQRPWLALYAAASKMYLACILVGIVWGLVTWLHPYHLENLAYLVGITVVGSAVVGPLMSLSRLARNPIRRGQVRVDRVAIVLTLGLTALVGLLAMPVTYSVKAPVVLLPSAAARVVTTTDGTLTEMLPSNTRVHRGEVIGRLVNAETQLELTRLEGEKQLRALRVEHLERLRGLDRAANDDLPTARAALADTERRLAEVEHHAKRLSISSPVSGTIIPPPRYSSANETIAETRLASWSGLLLDDINQGAYVTPGTLICLVGDPNQLDAVMLVSDVDVKRLEPGQLARIRLDQLPGQVIDGEVVDVSRYDFRRASTSGPQDLDSLLIGTIGPEQSGAIYQARVRFDARPEGLVIGGRGQAKVATERITLARMLLRYFAQTFRLPV